MQHLNTVLWKNTEGTSFEYSSLFASDNGFVAEGTVILMLENLPTKVTYAIECDKFWQTRHVEVLEEQASKTRKITLTVDNDHRWQENQKPLPLADNILDVDLEISPLTNTLPIHRSLLKIGESVQTTAVWVRFPGLSLELLKQQYTRLSDRCYRYEAPDLGFEAQLEVDEAGLIVKYGDLWMRIA